MTLNGISKYGPLVYLKIPKIRILNLKMYD